MEPAATALSAELTQLTHFSVRLATTSSRMVTDAKDFGRTGVALGGEFDFNNTNGLFDIRNKGRHAGHAVKERFLRPSVARSLGPRLGFAASHTFGRVGMLGMRALQDAAGRGVSLARKEAEYFLRSWTHYFANVRPRDFSSRRDASTTFHREVVE